MEIGKFSVRTLVTKQDTLLTFGKSTVSHIDKDLTVLHKRSLTLSKSRQHSDVMP